jgi:opacity protein-like surface antigen
MKKLSAVVSLAVGLAFCSVSAGAEGPYFTIDGGLNLVDNFDVGGGARIDFDPGVRFDVGVGYTLHQNQNVAISAGAEAGFLYNSTDKGVSPAGSVTMEGDLWQVPVLGKVTVKFMPESAWTPFIGVGGGVVYSRLEVTRIGGTATSLKGDDWDPAVQPFAGVKYKLNDNSSVALIYKGLFVFPGGGFEEVLNHGIVAAFSMQF